LQGAETKTFFAPDLICCADFSFELNKYHLLYFDQKKQSRS